MPQEDTTRLLTISSLRMGQSASTSGKNAPNMDNDQCSPGKGGTSEFLMPRLKIYYSDPGKETRERESAGIESGACSILMSSRLHTAHQGRVGNKPKPKPKP